MLTALLLVLTASDESGNRIPHAVFNSDNNNILMIFYTLTETSLSVPKFSKRKKKLT